MDPQLLQVLSEAGATHTKQEKLRKLGADGGSTSSSLTIKLDDRGNVEGGLSN